MRRALPAAIVNFCVFLCLYGPHAGLTGNDTGGIITWSPENAMVARDWAAEHCARYNKYARITSITARYGDYIAFTCQFDPRAPRP